MGRGNEGRHREAWNRLEETWLSFLTTSLTNFQVLNKSFNLAESQFSCMLPCFSPSQGPVRTKCDNEDDFHDSEVLDKGKTLQSMTHSRDFAFYFTWNRLPLCVMIPKMMCQ